VLKPASLWDHSGPPVQIANDNIRQNPNRGDITPNSKKQI